MSKLIQSIGTYESEETLTAGPNKWVHHNNTNEVETLSKREYLYLYSNLLIFDAKHQLGIFEKKEVFASGILLYDLYDSLSTAFDILVNNCYVVPSERQLSKHHTRYEKIIFNGKNLRVDYTTSMTGRLMFTLYTKLQFIKRIIDMNDILVISDFNQFEGE